jgi:hypothetical protein
MRTDISYNQKFSLKHQFKVMPMQMPTNFFVCFVGFPGGKQVEFKVYMEILMSNNSQEISGRKTRPERRACTHI